jgi:hypothetical protein
MEDGRTMRISGSLIPINAKRVGRAGLVKIKFNVFRRATGGHKTVVAVRMSIFSVSGDAIIGAVPACSVEAPIFGHQPLQHVARKAVIIQPVIAQAQVEGRTVQHAPAYASHRVVHGGDCFNEPVMIEGSPEEDSSKSGERSRAY